MERFVYKKRKVGWGPVSSSLRQPGHCGVAAGLLKVDARLGSRHTRAHLWFLDTEKVLNLLYVQEVLTHFI